MRTGPPECVLHSDSGIGLSFYDFLMLLAWSVVSQDDAERVARNKDLEDRVRHGFFVLVLGVWSF